MSSEAYPHLDGNAVAGELNRIFAFDITSAEGKCTNRGAKRHFAEAQWYVKCPGLVARCSECGHVLLRVVNAGGRLLLDMRGMTYLTLDTSQFQGTGMWATTLSNTGEVLSLQ